MSSPRPYDTVADATNQDALSASPPICLKNKSPCHAVQKTRDFLRKRYIISAPDVVRASRVSRITFALEKLAKVLREQLGLFENNA